MAIIAYPTTLRRFVLNVVVVGTLMGLLTTALVAAAFKQPSMLVDHNAVAFLGMAFPLAAIAQAIFIAAHHYEWVRWWVLGAMLIGTGGNAVGGLTGLMPRTIDAQLSVLVVGCVLGALAAPLPAICRRLQASLDGN